MWPAQIRCRALQHLERVLAGKPCRRRALVVPRIDAEDLRLGDPEKIDRLDGATLNSRPVIGAGDAPRLAWRALLMRPRGAVRAGESDVEGPA